MTCSHSPVSFPIINQYFGQVLNTSIMNLDNLLEVTSVQPMTSETTNKEFIKVTFRPVQFHPATGKPIYIGDKTGTRIYNPSKEPQLGQLFAGKISKFDTTPYQIGDNTVDSISCVAMDDENPQQVANDMLERHDACVTVNGKPTVDFAALKAERKAAAKAATKAKKAAAAILGDKDADDDETEE